MGGVQSAHVQLPRHLAEPFLQYDVLTRIAGVPRRPSLFLPYDGVGVAWLRSLNCQGHGRPLAIYCAQIQQSELFCGTQVPRGARRLQSTSVRLGTGPQAVWIAFVRIKALLIVKCSPGSPQVYVSLLRPLERTHLPYFSVSNHVYIHLYPVRHPRGNRSCLPPFPHTASRATAAWPPRMAPYWQPSRHADLVPLAHVLRLEPTLG